MKLQVLGLYNNGVHDNADTEAQDFCNKLENQNSGELEIVLWTWLAFLLSLISVGIGVIISTGCCSCWCCCALPGGVWGSFASPTTEARFLQWSAIASRLGFGWYACDMFSDLHCLTLVHHACILYCVPTMRPHVKIARGWLQQDLYAGLWEGLVAFSFTLTSRVEGCFSGPLRLHASLRSSPATTPNLCEMIYLILHMQTVLQHGVTPDTCTATLLCGFCHAHSMPA